MSTRKAYGDAVRSDTTAPDGETQTLAEYRAKYALYHSDEHLREIRRRFPLVAPQKASLKRALNASRARWKLVANQVMVTSLDAVPRNPLNTDSWDGYGADRRELVEALPENVAFVTGDIPRGLRPLPADASRSAYPQLRRAT
jgi:phosphodiesterase/alkaline phosphatase D-like protein